MKKLIFILPILVLFSCCKHKGKDSQSVKADSGSFIVSKIEAVESSSSVLCKYIILSDTLNSDQRYNTNEKERRIRVKKNTFTFCLIDTSGKYKIGDMLFLGFKTEEVSNFDSYDLYEE